MGKFDRKIKAKGPNRKGNGKAKAAFNGSARGRLTVKVKKAAAKGGRKSRARQSSIILPDGYRPSESEPFMSERHKIYFRNKLVAWKEEIVRAGGKTVSLDHVEHEIIRKQFREPRIHFALVCAARGCPPLRPEAYTGARLDAQLEDQARAFLARSPDKNRVDVPSRTVYLSPILDWYRDDFGGTRQAVGRYVARFFPEGPAKELLQSGDFELKYTDYDWSLNKR